MMRGCEHENAMGCGDLQLAAMPAGLCKANLLLEWLLHVACGPFAIDMSRYAKHKAASRRSTAARARLGALIKTGLPTGAKGHMALWGALEGPEVGLAAPHWNPAPT